MLNGGVGSTAKCCNLKSTRLKTHSFGELAWSTKTRSLLHAFSAYKTLQPGWVKLPLYAEPFDGSLAHARRIDVY